MKPNLILVHSFPTNSLLLNGLEEFLSDFFEVHLIDLPGFHKNSPPLKGKISVKKFSNYLDKKIAELNMDEYIVGGVSFGFLVVNNAKLDNRCKAILAMEPFINTKCLNIKFWQKQKYIFIALLLKISNFFGIEKIIWRSDWFTEYMTKETAYPKERIGTITKHFDCKTFFAVLRILLTYKKKPKFHDLPHFLIGNFADKTINFDATTDIFTKNVRELFIVSEPIDHYPKDLSKDYFKTRIPKEHINHMLGCLNSI